MSKRLYPCAETGKSVNRLLARATRSNVARHSVARHFFDTLI